MPPMTDGEVVAFHDGLPARTGTLATVRADGRAALCVDDDRPPFSFVTVEGPVTLGEDPEELLRGATVIGGRSMGAEQAEAYGRRNGVPGDLVVRLRPHHVVAAARVAE